MAVAFPPVAAPEAALPRSLTSGSQAESRLDLLGGPVDSIKFGKDATTGGSAPEVTVPAACPACQSRSITTTARTPDENTYWRCDSCGEVWNVARRQARSSGDRPWR